MRPTASADLGLHRLSGAGYFDAAAHGPARHLTRGAGGTSGHAMMPIVQSAGYPTYAERFPTRVRYTGMASVGVLDDYQQANLVIVPQA